MDLGQKATSILESWGAFDGGRRLEIEGEGISIDGNVAAADRLSCSLSGLRLRLREPGALGPADLEQWGDRIAGRIRYLLESLEAVELDAAQGKLLLRSTPPEKRPDGTVLYYELQLSSAGELELQRRRYDAAARSVAAEPMHVTREVLQKLVNDLAATAPQGS
jgi:hypothetical protein